MIRFEQRTRLLDDACEERPKLELAADRFDDGAQAALPPEETGAS
jgi:hypothetical protein